MGYVSENAAGKPCFRIFLLNDNSSPPPAIRTMDSTSHSKGLESTDFNLTTCGGSIMKVKVLRLGHSATIVEIADGATIEEALQQNEIPSQGYSISVNGLGAGGSAGLADGDVVTLVPKVEGGIG